MDKYTKLPGIYHGKEKSPAKHFAKGSGFEHSWSGNTDTTDNDIHLHRHKRSGENWDKEWKNNPNYKKK